MIKRIESAVCLGAASWMRIPIRPDPELLGQGGSGSWIMVPNPDRTFMTRISVQFFENFLQNGPIRLSD
jgi:hypothetical protein